MPIEIPSGHGQVSYQFRGTTGAMEDTVVTIGMRRNTSGVGSPAAPSTIFTKFNDAMVTFWTGRATSAWIYEGLRAKYNDGTTLLDFERSATTPGGSSSVPLPPQVAFLVRKASNLAGRKNKGRFYLPGCLTPASVDAGGTITGTVVTAMQTALNTLETESCVFAEGGGTAERKADFMILHTDATAPTLISQLVPQPLVATQRRRVR